MCITVFNHMIITCIIAQKALSSGIQALGCIGVQTAVEVVVFSSIFYLNWNHPPTIITLARKAWKLR